MSSAETLDVAECSRAKQLYKKYRGHDSNYKSNSNILKNLKPIVVKIF